MVYERVKQVIEPVKSQKQMLNQSANQQGNINFTIKFNFCRWCEIDEIITCNRIESPRTHKGVFKYKWLGIGSNREAETVIGKRKDFGLGTPQQDNVDKTRQISETNWLLTILKL